jgi:hypothetical protein
MINQKIHDINKNKIIDKLKYVFQDNNSELMNHFSNLSRTYKQNKEQELLKKSKLEHSNMPIDEILEDINRIKSDDIHTIFKKINIIFSVLSDLLRFAIMGISDERYQKVIDEKVIFPKTLDKLICIVGCYNKAFTQDIQEELFNIVDMPIFIHLYTISEIDHKMIPFVANDKINAEILKVDYLKFSKIVKNLSCELLDINTDFESDCIIEISTTCELDVHDTPLI